MKAVFVFAHPDDECVYSAGVIAKLTNSGVTVKLITATKGEAGQTGNPPLCKQEELGMVREQELRNAANVLGISDIYFLGYMDGTLNQIPQREISRRIQKILEKEKPDIVVTFNKEGGSRHPDHIYMSMCTTNAFMAYIKDGKQQARLYYAEVPKHLLKALEKQGTMYTAFGKIQGTPDQEITTIIDITETMDTKIKAFQCHKTQEQDWQIYVKNKDLPEFHFEYFRLIWENGFFLV